MDFPVAKKAIMKVLLLGGTGNLGSRVIPALLAHGHHVVAFVRSPQKLGSLISPDLIQAITIVQGDAFDSDAVAHALREYGCDAMVNTAGNHEPFWREQTLGKLVGSVTSAAVAVGKERGKPLRVWIIGGLTSLEYPGTGFKIQEYMPGWLIEHHRGTEGVIKSISTSTLVWSLLCVAFMRPESDKLESWSGPRQQNLLVKAQAPPGWQDHWIRKIPLIGIYLNLIPVIGSYTTKYEDVADLIAEDLAKEKSEFVGSFVGFKAPTGEKAL